MRTSSIAFALCATALTLCAADWAGYRGPGANGISAETIKPQTNPKLAWKIPTPTGFSSFAVAGGKAFTQIVRDGQEIVLAVNADTGKELWTANIGPGTFDQGGNDGAEGNKGGDGPRSTPSVSGNLVFAYTQDMNLFCLEAASGKPVWKKNILQEFQGRKIGWRSAMSPLLDGDFVFVACGGTNGSMLAFNKVSGALLWKSGTDKITHATPIAATIAGTRQIIYFLQSGLVSVSAVNGAELWRFPFRYNVSTASSPVVCDDIVYCSAGYGVGGGACQISKEGGKFTVKELYKIPGDSKIANHWSTPVYKDGYLYGMFSFKQYGRGPLKCVDVKTGQIKWERPDFGAGQVLLAGNTVIALADDGQVALVEATPSAYKELARFKAVEGKCWSTPALSNGRLYVRSTKEGACYDLAK